MRLSLPRNKMVIVLGSILLIAALVSGVYYLVVSPKLESLHQKEQELSTQANILSVLQNKITDTKTNTFQSTVALQKSVPVKPLEEQLVLDIEKAEVVSGSFVVNMTIEEGEVEEEKQEEKNEVGEKEQTQIDEAMDDSTKNSNPIPLPTGVKKLTINLRIESPTYSELEKFLSTLEGSNRIIVVESIDFTANEEIISTDQTNKPLTYQVVLSAFFMPSLTDLIDQLPKMDTPEPSNKKNPFSDFGEYDSSKIERNYDESISGTDDNSTGNENTTDEETEAPTEVPEEETEDTSNKEAKLIEYTVKNGDSLTKIANEFFHSKDGVQIIMDANGLKDDKISVGQVLVIPLEI